MKTKCYESYLHEMGIWYNEILYKINVENLHSIYIKHLNKTYLICDYNVGVTIIIYLFELF